MLHFLQPIWLLASAGILIPVAIHLWNVRQGKTLKVGSIELLARTAQQQARSLRFTELFLLLLRCLLVILMALLLAGPYWQQTSKQKGWIVVEKATARQVYEKYKPLMDSLLQAGYTVHLFEKGFAGADINTITAAKEDTAVAGKSYWQLLKMIDRQLLPGMPVYLFTGNQLNRFAGERPEINIALTWKTFSAGDSLHQFIAGAYETNGDSIAVTMGASTTSATNYYVQRLGKHQPRQNDFSLAVAEGRLQVAYKDQQPVAVDTASMRVAVFADEWVEDAGYVQAAVQSIQQVTGHKLVVKTVSRMQDIPQQSDWVFWLSAQPVSPAIQAKHFFCYVGGTPVAAHSWIQENDTDAQDKTELYKRIAYDKKDLPVLWRDGFGVPLLLKEERDGKQFYYCYTRFNPSWSELVWKASFPQVVYQLIDPASKRTNTGDDQRVIDESQLQLPTTTAVTKKTAWQTVDPTGTEHMIWAVVFLLFFMERYLSFQVKKIKKNA